MLQYEEKSDKRDHVKINPAKTKNMNIENKIKTRKDYKGVVGIRRTEG